MTCSIPVRAGLAVAIVIILGRGAASPSGDMAIAGEAAGSASPLEVLADCAAAVEEGDFARYVDHLSEREQQYQAGYALFTSSAMLQATGLGAAEIEPETLLFLRAVSDLIDEQLGTSDAAGGHEPPKVMPAAPPSPYPAPGQSVYAPSPAAVPQYPFPGVAGAVQPGEAFLQTAARLKDPRKFLIDVLTEYSRPVQISRAEEPETSSEPPFAEFVRAFREQEVTVYTRGDYAVAVPKNAAQPSAAQPPVAGAPPEPVESAGDPPATTTTSPWPLRIEFRRVNGQWKITRLLPLAELDPAVGISALASQAWPQPLTAPTSAAYAPPVYAPQPVAQAAPPYAPPTYAPAAPALSNPVGAAAASPPGPASVPN